MSIRIYFEYYKTNKYYDIWTRITILEHVDSGIIWPAISPTIVWPIPVVFAIEQIVQAVSSSFAIYYNNGLTNMLQIKYSLASK